MSFNYPLARKHFPIPSSIMLGLFVFWSAPVFAHGSGLFMVLFGMPLAAISFIASSIVINKTYLQKKSSLSWMTTFFYWAIVFLGFILWVSIYIGGVSILLDKGLLKNFIYREYEREQVISILMALLPITITMVVKIVFPGNSKSSPH